MRQDSLRHGGRHGRHGSHFVHFVPWATSVLLLHLSMAGKTYTTTAYNLPCTPPCWTQTCKWMFNTALFFRRRKENGTGEEGQDKHYSDSVGKDWMRQLGQTWHGFGTDSAHAAGQTFLHSCHMT